MSNEQDGLFENTGFQGNTSKMYDLSSMDQLDESLNIEISDGEMRPLLNSTLISPALNSVNTNYLNSQAFSGGRSFTATYNNTIYWAYAWVNGSNHQASLIVSYDHGNTWSQRVDIYTGSPDGMRIGIYVWRDKLFYFINYISSTASLCKLLVKEAPAVTWWNIVAAPVKTLLDNRAYDYDLANDDNNIYLSVQRTGEMEGYFYYYNGSIWSSGVKVVDKGHCARAGIEVNTAGTETRVLFFYSRNWVIGSLADGDLHMKYSTDLGTTWSSEIDVMDDDDDYLTLDCVNMNGTLIVFSNHVSRDEITIAISRNGGTSWSPEVEIVTDRGPNILHSSQYDFSVSYIENEDRVYLAYENSSNDLCMIYSSDYGSNWLSESNAVKIDLINSYDPRLCYDSKVVTYIFDLASNQDIRFRTLQSFEPIANFSVKECSPPSISSWDAIGFNITIPKRTFVHYRVLNGVDSSVLQGWTNLSSKTSGQINGWNFNKTDSFTGTWASSNLARSIKVEIRFFSMGMMHPSIRELYLDYSTTNNYNEDLSDLLWIDSYDCSWEPGWMNYSGVKRSERFVTEPLELERTHTWRDTLILDVFNTDQSNYIQVGILDAITGSPVSGFTTGDCSLIDQPSSLKTAIVNWGGKFISDLPSTTRAIQIEVIITSNPNAQPPVAIHRIWMSNNQHPEVVGIYATPSWSLFRTGWVEISVWVTDDIEMPMELDCRLYYRMPGSMDWDISYLEYSGVVGHLFYWNLSLPKDAPVGQWEIMTNVTDALGAFSGETISSDKIGVINNRPLPPEMDISPEIPLTADDITATLTSPGTDIEMTGAELTYKFEWYKNGDLFRSDENVTTGFSTISSEETCKLNEWKVKVYTYDGLEFSDPAITSVHVGNTVPFINGTWGPYHFDEDVGIAVIDIHAMFMDDDDDGLEFDVNSNVPYELDLLPGHILNINIPDDWNGEFRVNVSASDGELSNGTCFYVSIDPVNDLPILNKSEILVANEDEWFNYTFTGFDPADKDHVSFSINATEEIPGLVKGENFFFYDNGTLSILPDNDMVGEYLLNVTVDDGNGGMVWMDVVLVVKNVNDPPFGSIIEPIENMTVETGTVVVFNASVIDIDGDELEVFWTDDDGLTVGSGSYMTHEFAFEGTYIFTCHVSDGVEDVSLGTVIITVYAPIPDNTAPYGLVPSVLPETTGLDPLYALEVTSRWLSSREIPYDVPLMLSAYALDDEDELTFTWTLVEDTNWVRTGHEVTLPADTLAVGTYTFKVTVDDGNNHTVEATLDQISVIEPDHGIEEVAETLSLLLLITIIIVILIVILAVGLIIFLVMRKKKGEEEEKKMRGGEIVDVAGPSVKPEPETPEEVPSSATEEEVASVGQEPPQEGQQQETSQEPIAQIT
ncbi:MAG: hypothetical protein JW939_08295 [Candidatus Thermoplasmatota archaeon]|nr:hypothetical protein [Candidatus Thermoplasmatota archaeon]